MPRIEEHPEYKYAADLARVGPETWQSWIGALAAVAAAQTQGINSRRDR